MQTHLPSLPREAHLRMADIASKGSRKGITGLSEMTIRRLIKAGKFPAPRRYPDMKQATFFVYGEILDWLQAQANGGQQ